jgi:hypothetical protein
VSVVFGFDATSVTRTDIKIKKGANEGVMVFMVLPLDRTLPGFVIHVAKAADMKVNQRTVNLCQREAIEIHLRRNHFNAVAVATDGDPPTSKRHMDFFERYSGGGDKLRTTIIAGSCEEAEDGIGKGRPIRSVIFCTY